MADDSGEHRAAARRAGAAAAVLCALVVAGLPAAASPAVTVPPRDGPAPTGEAAAPGRVLVGAAAGRAVQARAAAEQAGGRVVSFYGPGQFLVVEIPAQAQPAAWAGAVRGRPGVRFAEPDYVITAEHHVIPDDPLWPDLWGMARISAPEAWHDTTGSETVVVGIADSGIDYTHPDLADRIWRNPLETANGNDDDGNGWVDDVHGADCRNDDGDPLDDYWHGTHVAGTVGAAGDNATGVVGVNWDVRLMALKILGSDGSAFVSDAVTCIDYSIAQGVRVTNHSWALSAFSQSLYDAVARARDAGQVVVAAAGNQGLDADVNPRYPAAFDLDNVISVANTDANDALAPSSNHGATSVDLAAPGTGILSTDLTTFGLYYVSSGTSMAAPHVTGVVALLLSLDRTLPYGALRDHVLGSVEPVPALSGKLATGGRLDAAGAVASLLDAWVPDPPSGLVGAVTGSGDAVDLTWTAGTEPHLAGYHAYRATASEGPFTRLTDDPLADPELTDGDVAAGGTYHYRVTAVDNRGKESDPSASVAVTVGEVEPPDDPPAPAGLAVTDPGTGRTLSLSWDASAEPDVTGYHAYRAGAATGPWLRVAEGVPETAFTDTGLTDGATYHYHVTAVTADGRESAPSQVASGTPTDVTPPAAPGGLDAVGLPGAIGLAWDAGGEPDLADYLVARTEDPPGDGERSWTVVATTTTAAHTDSDVTAGTVLYYRVHARDGSGNVSPPSAEVEATALPPAPSATTYTVTSVTVTRSGRITGTVGNLDEADGVYWCLEGDRRGAQHWLDVEAATTIAEIAPQSLTITWRRHYTVEVAESFSVYDQVASKWVELSGVTAGSADETLEWTTTAPERYLSPAGEVRVKLFVRERVPYTACGDLLVFTVEP